MATSTMTKRELPLTDALKQNGIKKIIMEGNSKITISLNDDDSNKNVNNKQFSFHYYGSDISKTIQSLQENIIEGKGIIISKEAESALKRYLSDHADEESLKSSSTINTEEESDE